MQLVDNAGLRLALLVATSAYSDPDLRELRAPGLDADDLAAVLGDPRIGGFDVRMLVNAASGEVQEGIEDFCADRRPADQLLIYLSCHGVLDSNGRLYYAASNTRRQRLAATAVAAGWLNERLEDCRARSQFLILDCCHSGAFARGAKGDAELALQQRFEPRGRGRVVLTASRDTEYSFEGDQATGEGARSIFTHAIVNGLRTGDADRDKDGLITVTDLSQYVYDNVRAAESRQTPELWLYGAEGDLLVAHSIRGAVIEPVPLPEDLRITLESPRPRVRETGVAELAELLGGADPRLTLTAQRALQRIADEDQLRVAELARAALEASPAAAAEQVQQALRDRGLRKAEARQEDKDQATRQAEYRVPGAAGTRQSHADQNRTQRRTGVKPDSEATGQGADSPTEARPVTAGVSEGTAGPRSQAPVALLFEPEFRQYIPPEIPRNIPRDMPPLLIALWGSPGSGKTTFLSTLNIAFQRMDSGWNLRAVSGHSEEMLVNTAKALVGRGAFPAATSQLEVYPLILQGRIPARRPRIFRKEQPPGQAQVRLDVVDLPGENMSSDPDPEQLIELLLKSNGICFMFDPVREFRDGDAYELITSMCNQLSRRIVGIHGGDGRLWQFLAVCITKFDAPQVLEMARKAELLTADPHDPHAFPRVHDDDAREFFRRLCEVSAGRNGDMVITALEHYFRPERIRYFVTSATGFYTDSHSRIFNPDDSQNVIPGPGPEHDAHVRGSIRPINIAEPLLWLTRQLIISMAGNRA
jgi:hypothetical protein